MAEWREVSLASLYSFSSGLSKPRSAFGSGYPFLTFKDVFYNHFVPDELGERVQSTEEERSSCSIERGDVFLTRTSETHDELGMSSVALRSHPGGTFNGFTKRLRPRPDAPVIPEFAGYYFRSPGFRRQVTAMASLSTRASLSNGMLERLSMVLPPIEKQVAIAGVLKALDDKIELNRRMNTTIQAILRGTFRAWFGNLDERSLDSGLIAGSATWPPGTLGAVAARVVDRVRDPLEWSGQKLIDLARIPQRSMALTDWGVGKELTTSIIRFKRGDTLFGAIRPYFHKVGIAPFDGVTNVSVFVIRARQPSDAAFVTLLCSSSAVVDFATQVSRGTKMPVVSWPDLERFPLRIPPPELRDRFGRLAAPLLDRLIGNALESNTLAELRDRLLPRLVSGQLRTSPPAPMAAPT